MGRVENGCSERGVEPFFMQHLQAPALAMQRELVSVPWNTVYGFRLVCATTVDLEKLTDEGPFYDELFYRVASLPVTMPTLRKRTDDIPQLVRHFLVKAANPHFYANGVEFTPDALAVLAAYHWPGKVVELSRVDSKIAATTATRVIASQQLPLRRKELKDWPTLADHLAGPRQQGIDRILHVRRGQGRWGQGAGSRPKLAGVTSRPPEREMVGRRSISGSA